jgi:diguanylate cyclase (GGDEF)-like protein
VSRVIDRTDQRLYTLVSFVALVGLVAVAASAAVALKSSVSLAWTAVVALALLAAAGDMLKIKVRVRSTGHATAWTDAAMLLGLAVMPAPGVVLATACGVAATKIFPRIAPIKSIFAVAKDSVVAAVGGLVLLAFGEVDSLLGPVGIAPLAVAFVAMTVVDQGLTLPVIALASRTPVLERFRTNWDIRLLTAAGRFGFVVLAVLTLQLEPQLLYGFPLIVVIAYVWHERWVRTREERQAWQHLAAATELFTGVDLDVVLREAVKGGVRLFSGDELEVEVWLGGERRLVRGTADEITYDGLPEHAPEDGVSVYATALHGYRGRRDIGVLRLRFRSAIAMSEREHAMLDSYAAALDTAIRNASAYLQLGEATAAHAHAAAHDPLTGLANRRELERLLAEALASPTGLECRIALMMVDLKHFKEVNDTLGHLTGDQVLVRVAARMAAAVGTKDLVARFGGDEFAVLLRSAYRTERVRVRAERVLAALAEPIEVDGLPLVVEANAGLALAVDPQDEPALGAGAGPGARDAGEAGDAGEAVDAGSGGGSGPAFRSDPAGWKAELMRRADVAMYQAKRSARRLMCYTPAGDLADRDRLTLAGQLPEAVAQRQFVLHYQPIVDLASGRVRGVEALARWRHPTRGELEPRHFLDLLERSKHLSNFTAAVLEDALAAADLWRAAGHDLSVSVNISPRSLLDTGLPRMVLDALEAHRTRPEQLCLELTETLAISQLETVDQVLTQLHDLGVRLALDDFGTGYSSLAVLSRIPVHELKVDRSFVRSLREPGSGPDPDPADPDGADPGRTYRHPDTVNQARAVIRSTVQLGRSLELTVVAEGVETAAQRRQLWQLGCTYGQGHLFAAALPADQLLGRLTRGVGDRPGHLAAAFRSGDRILAGEGMAGGGTAAGHDTAEGHGTAAADDIVTGGNVIRLSGSRRPRRPGRDTSTG